MPVTICVALKVWPVIVVSSHDGVMLHYCVSIAYTQRTARFQAQNEESSIGRNFEEAVKLDVSIISSPVVLCRCAHVCCSVCIDTSCVAAGISPYFPHSTFTLTLPHLHHCRIAVTRINVSLPHHVPLLTWTKGGQYLYPEV